MKPSVINITLQAKDIASGVIKNVDKSLDGMRKGFKNFANTVAKGVGIVAGLGAGLTALAVHLVRVGSKAEDLRPAFVRAFGDAEQSLQSLRNASKGTISDIDLMATANRASLLGVATNVEDLSKLMVTARLRGKAMGLDTTQAFNDIVTGIGRGSAMILDNLGIVIPDSIKKTVETMDEASKKQVLLNYAIEDGALLMKELGDDNLSTSDRFAILSAMVENTKQKIGEALAPALLTLADEYLPMVEEGLIGLVDWFTANQDKFVEVFKKVIEGAESISRGFVEAQKTYGVEADRIINTYILPNLTDMNGETQSLNQVMENLGIGVAWVWGGIKVAIIGALTAVVLGMKFFSSFFINGWKMIADSVIGSINLVISVINKFIESYNKFLNAVGSDIKVGYLPDIKYTQGDSYGSSIKQGAKNIYNFNNPNMSSQNQNMTPANNITINYNSNTDASANDIASNLAWLST